LIRGHTATPSCKNVTPFSNGVIGGYNDRVFLRPDGMPEDIAVVQSNVYLPGGPEVDRDPVGAEILGSWKLGSSERPNGACRRCERTADRTRTMTPLLALLVERVATPPAPD
jgi:hypothetical protein